MIVKCIGINQRIVIYFAMGSITVPLVSSLTGLDSPKQENILLFVCSKATSQTRNQPFSDSSPYGECSLYDVSREHSPKGKVSLYIWCPV